MPAQRRVARSARGRRPSSCLRDPKAFADNGGLRLGREVGPAPKVRRVARILRLSELTMCDQPTPSLFAEATHTRSSRCRPVGRVGDLPADTLNEMMRPTAAAQQDLDDRAGWQVPYPRSRPRKTPDAAGRIELAAGDGALRRSQGWRGDLDAGGNASSSPVAAPRAEARRSATERRARAPRRQHGVAGARWPTATRARRWAVRKGNGSGELTSAGVRHLDQLQAQRDGISSMAAAPRRLHAIHACTRTSAARGARPNVSDRSCRSRSGMTGVAKREASSRRVLLARSARDDLRVAMPARRARAR